MHTTKFILATSLTCCAQAWVITSPLQISSSGRTNQNIFMLRSVSPSNSVSGGNLHGQNACFLPLEQLDQDYEAPRIVQIAGSYPGLTREEFFAVTSEPPPEAGQWSYDFSDPDGPQMGTVAVRGTEITATAIDPVVIISEHFSLGVPLPEELKEAVDLLVMVDRAKNKYKDRKFLVLDLPGEGVVIRAYATKAEMPAGADILGQVVFCQIPWLPCMKSTRSGFMEEEELY